MQAQHGTKGFVGRRQFVAMAAASGVALMALPLAAKADTASKDDSGSSKAAQSYTAGTYTATARGKKGDITVEVTFTDSAIESIEVTSSLDTPRIAKAPFAQIPEDIVKYQSLAVDTVAGATFSSNGVIDAVTDAVKQAGGDADALAKVEIPAPEASKQELEADIVVVGAGAAGMGAAIACTQKGAKVVVFEKCANMGGNCLVSGGMMQDIDAPDELRADITDGLKNYFEDTLQKAEGIGCPTDVTDGVRKEFEDYYANGSTKVFDSVNWESVAGFITLGSDTYTDEAFQSAVTYNTQSVKLMEWLSDLPITWQPLVGIAGYPWPDWAKPTEGECGEGYFAAFDTYLEEQNQPIDFLFSTPADKLIAKDGKVTGVHGTCADGTEYTVSASKAVILATGGFSGSQEMLKAHDDGWGFDKVDYIPTTNNYGHTGDGVTMAQEVGAAFADASPSYMVLPFSNDKDWSVESMIGNSGNALLVNKEGKRFVNEGLGRNDISKVEMQQTDGKAFLISCQANSQITDAGENQFGMKVEQLIADGKAFKADTLAELAEQIGIDADTLEATVDTYNEYAKAGSDPDFGRTMFDETSPVEEGPFYASPVTWAVHITCCGLSVNWDNYAILDEQGNDIPGLYGIGEVIPTTGGIMTMANGLVLAEQLLGE